MDSLFESRLAQVETSQVESNTTPGVQLDEIAPNYEAVLYHIEQILSADPSQSPRIVHSKIMERYRAMGKEAILSETRVEKLMTRVKAQEQAENRGNENSKKKKETNNLAPRASVEVLGESYKQNVDTSSIGVQRDVAEPTEPMASVPVSKLAAEVSLHEESEDLEVEMDTTGLDTPVSEKNILRTRLRPRPENLTKVSVTVGDQEDDEESDPDWKPLFERLRDSEKQMDQNDDEITKDLNSAIEDQNAIQLATRKEMIQSIVDDLVEKAASHVASSKLAQEEVEHFEESVTGTSVEVVEVSETFVTQEVSSLASTSVSLVEETCVTLGVSSSTEMDQVIQEETVTIRSTSLQNEILVQESTLVGTEQLDEEAVAGETILSSMEDAIVADETTVVKTSTKDEILVEEVNAVSTISLKEEKDTFAVDATSITFNQEEVVTQESSGVIPFCREKSDENIDEISLTEENSELLCSEESIEVEIQNTVYSEGNTTSDHVSLKEESMMETDSVSEARTSEFPRLEPINVRASSKRDNQKATTGDLEDDLNFALSPGMLDSCCFEQLIDYEQEFQLGVHPEMVLGKLESVGDELVSQGEKKLQQVRATIRETRESTFESFNGIIFSAQTYASEFKNLLTGAFSLPSSKKNSEN